MTCRTSNFRTFGCDRKHRDLTDRSPRRETALSVRQTTKGLCKAAGVQDEKKQNKTENRCKMDLPSSSLSLQLIFSPVAAGHVFFSATGSRSPQIIQTVVFARRRASVVFMVLFSFKDRRRKEDLCCRSVKCECLSKDCGHFISSLNLPKAFKLD